jgi:hypothetical protein
VEKQQNQTIWSQNDQKTLGNIGLMYPARIIIHMVF